MIRFSRIAFCPHQTTPEKAARIGASSGHAWCDLMWAERNSTQIDNWNWHKSQNTEWILELIQKFCCEFLWENRFVGRHPGSSVPKRIQALRRMCCFVSFNRHCGLVMVPGFPQRRAKEHVPTTRKWIANILSFFLSWVARPNLITGLSGWWAHD